MKPLLIAIFLFLCCEINAQQIDLYNQRGITFSYTSTVPNIVNCNQDKTRVDFVKLHYTITNKSDQAIIAHFSLQMSADAFADCTSEFRVLEFDGSLQRCPDQVGSDVTLKPGANYSGDVGNWYYKTNVPPTDWSFKPEFIDQTAHLEK